MRRALEYSTATPADTVLKPCPGAEGAAIVAGFL